MSDTFCISTEGIEVLRDGRRHLIAVVSVGDGSSPPCCYIDGKAVDLPNTYH